MMQNEIMQLRVMGIRWTIKGDIICFIFSTKLAVAETLTEDKLIQYVVTWLNDNKNYHFHELTYKGEDNYIRDTGYENLEIVQYPEALTIRLISHSNGVIWTNDYVLKKGMAPGY